MHAWWSVQVWVTHSLKMHKQEFAKKLLDVVGTGILFAEDEHWQRQRRFLSPAFTLREIKVGIQQERTSHTSKGRRTTPGPCLRSRRW